MDAASTIPARERDVVRAALDHVQTRLPPGWRLEAAVEPADRTPRPDAIVTLTPPHGTTATLVVEAKRHLVTRDLPAVVAQLNSEIAASFPARRGGNPGGTPMVVAPYLSASQQQWLAERDVAYADATGNLRLTLHRPALFLRDVGATKDPWRGPGRPRGDLIGEPAARVVRALADYVPPYSVPRLVTLSGASTGPTYRVVAFLEEENIVDREPRGPITSVRWADLLRRWAADYGLQSSNTVTSWLAPRGLPAVTKALAGLPDQPALRYAATGSWAAEHWAPHAPARAAVVYCDDPTALAGKLGLRPVDSGANVLLVAPAYNVVYDRTVVLDGVTTVAPSQAAVDLLTGPGRNPAEGTALLEWMEANDAAWRR